MLDPYVNPKTNVLKNKLGITDQKELDEAESIIAASKLIDVDSVKGNFDYQHLMDIHRHIFGDLYEWAGEPRTINIEKGEKVLAGMSVNYGRHENIREEVEKALVNMKAIQWNKLNSYDEKSESFSRVFSELWKTHPFREGNTRTITEFFTQYAATQNIFMDKKLFATNPAYFRSSLVLSSIDEYSERSHLEVIVKDSMHRGDKLRELTKSKEQEVFSLNGLKKIDSAIKSKYETKAVERERSPKINKAVR